jgi:hypothetical protein
MATTTDELSGIFAATVTTATGRVVYNEGDADEIAFWLREFSRAERLAEVDVRELSIADAHGVWSSPGA